MCFEPTGANSIIKIVIFYTQAATKMSKGNLILYYKFILASYPYYVFNSQVLSKPHANISLENGRLFLSDCGSSNGSYLNNVRLSSAGKKSNKVEIFSEDVIRCDTSKIENLFVVWTHYFESDTF